MNKNDRYYKSLLENYEEAAFKLLVYEQAMEEADDIKPEDIPEDVARHADEAYPCMIKRIRSEMRNHSVRMFMKKQLPKITKSVAAFILVAYIGATIAIASSATVRRYVVEFLIERYETHSTASFAKNGKALDVPVDWTADYYLSYLPEGFSLRSVADSGDFVQADFIDNDESIIVFIVGDIRTTTCYNSEDGEIILTKVNDVDAEFMKHKSNTNFLIWSIGDTYFVLISKLPQETMIELAEGVVMIR